MATTIKSRSTTKNKKPVKTTKKASSKGKTTNKKAASPVKVTTKTTITTKNTAKSPLNPLERIRSIHISSALVYLIFTALVLGFVSTTAVAVRLGIQARDEFGSSPQEVVLGPANEVLFNLEPKYILAIALLTGALFSILLASKLRSRYEATLVNRTSGLRWLALGISAGLTLEFVNLLAGVNNAALLVLTAVMVFLAAMFGFISERENAGSIRPKWLAFSLGLVTGALAWLPLVGTLIGTTLYGMERFGWHVYALAAVLLIGFTVLAINQYRYIRTGATGDYLGVEERYLRFDLFTKFAVVIVAILALD